MIPVQLGSPGKKMRPSESPVYGAVCILGMHRSGTSCLTGSLQEAGLYLGNVVEKGQYNLKGSRENKAIMALNEAILNDNGGSWHDPPVEIVWTCERVDERSRIIAEYSGRSPWGFKDPRTVFTIDGWLDALPDARLTGSFRHPCAVARSLGARNGFPLSKGYDLWLRYNERLLRLHDMSPFPLLNFDLEAEAYRDKMSSIAKNLNLPRAGQRNSFYSADLRNHAAKQHVDLPNPVLEVYRELLSRAL